MKDEIKAWVTYATENLDSARILLEQHLLNPCLQNVQQSIEKYLKALLLEKTNTLRKTHSISELVQLLAEHQVYVDLSEEDCDLLDSIYLPSKYPLSGVLPDFEPDIALCRQCVALAEKVAEKALRMVG
ncbi:HEPN domain-containing protein [Candidatus Parcubacteria bacterium]|nr:MAG: HEPN domain-containing protein [Candidatus Parcubacteria bacterium]